MRFKVLKARIPVVPRFWWHVAGRRLFDRSVSPRIKAMWKLGAYNTEVAR
ncbi:hypothetical protein SJ05684_c10580 [Sinorhizobium sojae CCBAU 05684]|uniref:Uncharacterized protein n=1 Tax=Sinorhizobium sojae CCBAU 05684 TaxID=716928 RepID=A0A249P9R1_9HYPH|nr:hypothetical protein SJ05684_c10580 [Sinorhizobium sojae CCBAU 05684]